MDKEAKELIKQIQKSGIEIHTSTKARGHQGFYMQNRIDISKNIPEYRIIPTLLHEFAHYIHHKIEPSMGVTGGTLDIIFKEFDKNITNVYKKELLSVTNFVDKQSKCEKLLQHKQLIKTKILAQEKIIKAKYPEFLRSKKFKEFDKYIKKSKAKYLLKYDRVKIITGILFKKTETYTIDTLEKDFPDMPKEYCAYIRLKSLQKKQGRISARINKLNKYYQKPTELFARFVEGLYLYPQTIKDLTPNSYTRFIELMQTGYYHELASIYNEFINQ